MDLDKTILPEEVLDVLCAYGWNLDEIQECFESCKPHDLTTVADWLTERRA